MAEQLAHLLCNLDRAARRRNLDIALEPAYPGREELVHPRFDGDPGLAVAVEVRLVHRQRNVRNIDFAHEPNGGRQRRGSGMSKELAIGDQSTEPVTPDPRTPSASWVLRIGKTHPATKASSTRVDRECAPLGD